MGNRYTVDIATPKDFGSHYKNILHRQFLTNSKNKEAPSPMCRVCNCEVETIEHFGKCKGLSKVYTCMRVLDGENDWDDLRLNLLGVRRNGHVIAKGTSLAHFAIWKHIIIQLTEIGLNKRQNISSTEIIEAAKLRIAKRIRKQ